MKIVMIMKIFRHDIIAGSSFLVRETPTSL